MNKNFTFVIVSTFCAACGSDAAPVAVAAIDIGTPLLRVNNTSCDPLPHYEALSLLKMRLGSPAAMLPLIHGSGDYELDNEFLSVSSRTFGDEREVTITHRKKGVDDYVWAKGRQGPDGSSGNWTIFSTNRQPLLLVEWTQTADDSEDDSEVVFEFLGMDLVLHRDVAGAREMLWTEFDPRHAMVHWWDAEERFGYLDGPQLDGICLQEIGDELCPAACAT